MIVRIGESRMRVQELMMAAEESREYF